MQTQVAFRAQSGRVASSARSARAVRVFAAAGPAQQRAQQQQEQASVSRRDVLNLGLAAALSAPLLASASPALAADVSSLNFFEKGAQRAEFQKVAEAALSEVLTSADAPSAFRLLFNDAATYDSVTGTGGVDGSIVLSDELDRPENAMLKPYVEKLKVAKAKIDAEGAKSGGGAISWADLEVLAVKVTAQAQWKDAKFASAKTASGAQIIVDNYSANFPVQLGRVDRTEAAPAGRVPQPDASVEEVRQFLLKLGADPNAKPGPFTAKPPFWERPGFLVWTAAAVDPAAEEQRLADANKEFAGAKRKYDISRGTITRTDYEVDFINLVTRVASLGAKFDPNAYLH